jgi:hypothetical protein
MTSLIRSRAASQSCGAGRAAISAAAYPCRSLGAVATRSTSRCRRAMSSGSSCCSSSMKSASPAITGSWADLFKECGAAVVQLGGIAPRSVYDTDRTNVRSQVMQRYTIGQLAAEVGVNVETIRYYPTAQAFSRAATRTRPRKTLRQRRDRAFALHPQGAAFRFHTQRDRRAVGAARAEVVQQNTQDRCSQARGNRRAHRRVAEAAHGVHRIAPRMRRELGRCSVSDHRPVGAMSSERAVPGG